MSKAYSFSSSRRHSTTKGGVIQPGSIVSAFYGPFSSETYPDRKNRSCTKFHGVVLSSFSENQWLVHWFIIGKNSSVPFNKATVDEATSPMSQELVRKMLQENSENYIDGTDELRSYVDNVSKLSSQKKRSAGEVSKIQLPTNMNKQRKNSTEDRPSLVSPAIRPNVTSKPPPFTQRSNTSAFTSSPLPVHPPPMGGVKIVPKIKKSLGLLVAGVWICPLVLSHTASTHTHISHNLLCSGTSKVLKISPNLCLLLFTY